MTYPAWTQRGEGTNPHRGLAPLGLEPVAGRLIDRLMPGLNNVTWRVRYYSFFAWALSTFVEYGPDRTDRAQHRWLVRMENIFRFATLYANKRDARATWGLVGINVAGKLDLPMDDRPNAQLDVGSEYAASAFVPAAYKASFTGLGCAESYPTWVDLTARTGLRLAGAFESAVRSVDDADAERKLLLSGQDKLPAHVIHRLADAIRLREVPASSPENPLLADLLFRVDEPREGTSLRDVDLRRTRSLTLFLHLLDRAAQPLTEWDFHRIFAGGFLPDGRPVEVPRTLHETWTFWQAYQEREFQRVALYGLLHALIPFIEEQARRPGGASARTLADAMWRTATESEIAELWLAAPLATLSVQEAQQRMLAQLDRRGIDTTYSLESLASYVSESQDPGNIVAGSLLLFLLVTAYWEDVQASRPEWARQIHESGGAGRLSLGYITRETAARGSLSLQSLTDWLVETCILSQLLQIAVQKLVADGNAYRFFVTMGDKGYTVVKPPADGRFYYPPRIAPALHLLSELDLLSYGVNAEFSMQPRGYTQLEKAQAFLERGQ